LNTSSLFIVQVLQIIHLIFTFLAFTFTSFTVCLSSSNIYKRSVCWYFVCFFMSLVSFLCGLVVIILLIIWQKTSLNLLDENGIQILGFKDFGWTFWVSVGIHCLICLAGFLILLHILIESMIIYFSDKKIRKLKSSSKANSDISDKYLYTANGAIMADGNNDHLAECLQANINTNNNLNSKQTRTQSANPYPPIAPPMVLPLATNLKNSKLTPPQNSSFKRNFENNENKTLAKENNNNQQLGDANHFSSPSYIFYTGHGQYRKQSIVIESEKQQNVPFEYELANSDILNQPNSLLNYTNLTGSANLINTSGSNDHPYSNVSEAVNQINSNDLGRYLNYR
jgi:hypothetical protein